MTAGAEEIREGVKLYTIPELCRATGWSKAFVYQRLINTGKLPVIRVGRTARVDARDLARLLEENKIGA